MWTFMYMQTHTHIYTYNTHILKERRREGEVEGGKEVGRKFISEAEVQEFVLIDLLGDSDAHLSLRTMDRCNLKEIREQKVK